MPIMIVQQKLMVICAVKLQNSLINTTKVPSVQKPYYMCFVRNRLIILIENLMRENMT